MTYSLVFGGNGEYRVLPARLKGCCLGGQGCQEAGTGSTAHTLEEGEGVGSGNTAQIPTTLSPKLREVRVLIRDLCDK